MELDRLASQDSPQINHYLTEADEKELATEMLLARHKFTTLVFENRTFRQAAITVIQNIYLFRRRKIFFGTFDTPAEQERQEALLLFSQSPASASVSSGKSISASGACPCLAQNYKYG